MRFPFRSILLFFLFFATFLFSTVLTPSLPNELIPENSKTLPVPYKNTDDDLSNQLVPASEPTASSLHPSDEPPTNSKRFLLVTSNGTIYSVHGGAIQWELQTGSPVVYSESALSSSGGDGYFVYADSHLELYEYNKDIGIRKLNETIQEFVLRTPVIKGSMLIVGSKTTTLLRVNEADGRVIHSDQFPFTWQVDGSPKVEEKLITSKFESSKREEDPKELTIVRTDYFLNASDQGKHMWSVKVSHVTSLTDNGNGQRSKLGAVPGSSTPGKVLVFYSEPNDIKPVLQMLQTSCRSLDSCLLGGDIEEGDVPEILASSTNQLVQMPVDRHMHLYSSQDSFTSGNECPSGNCIAAKPHARSNIISTPEKTCRDANSCPVESYHAAQQNFNRDSYGVFPLLMISLFVILPILCYLQVKDDKKLDNVRGKQSIVTKKRKSRKSGNVKNGASNYDNSTSSEKETAESHGHQRIQSNEERSINLISSDHVGEGRWVGKLFMSNSEIGRGSNGTVVLQGIYDGRQVAVKRLLRAHHDVAFKEIQNLAASDRHPNIVRWYGVEQDLDFVYIALERCACSLSDLIQLCSDSSHPTATGNPTLSSIDGCKIRLDFMKDIDKDLELWSADGFPSSLLLKLMRDVISGLAHLHELGIIHRDLKPQNVLIGNDRILNAKLSDMGISKRLLEDMSSLSHHVTGYGSSGWQAPEQLLQGRQTRAMDLFSLGCILFFCITKGKHPFGNHFDRDSNIVKNHVDLFLVDHIPEAVHLLSHLLDPDPKLRPNAVEVLHHPLFWSSELRLTFLRDVSDRVELEDRENESELLKAFENIALVAFGGKWGDKLDAAFITDMGRYRKYKFDCVRDLLRVIRNKLNHYRELPKDLQEILGPVPEGFDRYFSSRFPKLLIEVYKVVCRYCREEKSFSKYFESSLL